MPIAYAENYRLDILAEDLDYPWSLDFLQTEICYLRVVRIVASFIEGRRSERTDRERTRGLPCSKGGLFDVLVDPTLAKISVYFVLRGGDANSNQTTVVAKLLDNQLQDVQVIFAASRPNTLRCTTVDA